MGKNRQRNAAAGIQQAVARSSGVVPMDPELVHYSHSRIRPVFSGCGRRVMDTLADIEEGRMKLEDLPRIQVVLAAGGYVFSLNNRRLFVLKQLRAKGLLPGNKVIVRTRPPKTHEIDRYTPERCSLVGKLMREKKQKKSTAGDGGDSEGDGSGSARGSDSDSGGEEGERGAAATSGGTGGAAPGGAAAEAAAGSDKIVGVPTEQLDADVVRVHAQRVEELLDGVETDEDL